MQNKPGEITHGLSYTRFYRIYKGVMCRGTKKYYKNYKNIVCEWKDFQSFKYDMYNSYLNHCKEFGEKNTSIDRVNTNGNYCKKNCRWATRRIQSMNRKNSLYYKGEYLIDICLRKGIKYNSVICRIKRGWTMEEAINTPIKTTGLKYKGINLD